MANLDVRVDRLRVRHLRLLDLVADLGSLSAAAQALHVSQPGATKMLHELEAAFGCTLIERTARGGQLSPAGAHALGRLRIALGALDAAREGLVAQADVPLVRLGLLPLVAVSALPAVVASLSRAGTLPRLAVREGTVEALQQMLVAGELDCVIGRFEGGDPTVDRERFHVTRLWAEGLGVAAGNGHPLARRRALDLEAMKSARWALPSLGSHTRLQFDRLFMDAGTLPPAPYIESMSLHTNLSLAATGAVLTIAPRSALQHYEKLKMVKEMRMGTPFGRGYMVFVTLQESAKTPGVALLESAMRAWAGAES